MPWSRRAGEKLPPDPLAGLFGLPPRLDAELVAYLRGAGDPALPSRLDETQRAALAGAPLEARAGFYRSVSSLDRADDGILVRLGRLLAQLPLTRYPLPERVPAPSWALLEDSARSLAHAGSRGDPPPWTIDRLRGLLAAEGVPDASLDAVLADILIGTSRTSLRSEPWGLQRIPGIAQFAAAHPLAVEDAASRFGESAHLELAALASGHQPLARAMIARFASEAAAGGADRRAAALGVLAGLPSDEQLGALAPVLARARGSARIRAVEAIARVPDAAAASRVLATELEARPGGPGAAELRRTIAELAPLADAGLTDAPAIPPFVPLDDAPVADATLDAIRAALQERLEASADPDEAASSVAQRRQRLADAIAALPEIGAYLSGAAPHPGAEVLDPIVGIVGRIPALTPAQRIRAGARPGGRWGSYLLGARDVGDARAVADVLARAGCTPQEAIDTMVRGYLSPPWEGRALRPAQLVGFIREHPEPFDRVLGLATGAIGYDDHRTAVLEILELVPALTNRELPVVAALATGDAKAHRHPAQRVLMRHGLAWPFAAQALATGAAEERSAAAVWITELGGPRAAELLAGALGGERVPSVRARLVAGLDRLGEDVSRHLTPVVLEEEAERGRGSKGAVVPAWFPFDELPPCRYANGEEVPAVVLRWWIRLAAQLRDPSGAGLLPLYLRTLDRPSAEALSRRVLLTWIARDAAPIEDAVVMERAMREVAKYERRIAAMLPADSDFAFSADHLMGVLDRERAAISRATPSAIADKGILSLCGAVPGPELAETVRQYLRRHHLKRAQIEALLHTLAASDAAEPQQLLVSIARRYRTASIQRAAGALVEQLAERRGWTPDELADRMVPTASLDAGRVLEIDYGVRVFTARLAESLAFELRDPDGAVIRALPAPRVDEESGAAARAAFTVARKELAAVVRLQRRRLYDAMCVRRTWRASDWREVVLEHPIVGLIAAGIVWQVDGVTVRPDADGTLRGVDDAVVRVPDAATVTIAHPTTVEASVVDRWRAKPGPVDAGIDQFRAVPVASGADPVRSELSGRASTAFELRGWARRHEWDRGPTEDDARFFAYVKTFSGAGLQAVLEVSGSVLPEEDRPVELGGLRVRVLDASGRPGEFAGLDELPAALLAELVADCLDVG